MTLRVPDDLASELRAAADATHVSINSFVIDAIRQRIEESHHETVMAIARKVIDSDAEILDRLAKA
jgi:uncharacterized protein (DUF1778 family)